MVARFWQRLRSLLAARGGGLLGGALGLLSLGGGRPEPAVYAQVRPSVVQIKRAGEAPGAGKVGSGVVVDENGSILTAYHVVAGATEVTVRFFDGSETTATVDQTLPERDLAVVRAFDLPANVQPATPPGGARPGHHGLAIGSPLRAVGRGLPGLTDR